jgi:ribonuclease-3
MNSSRLIEQKIGHNFKDKSLLDNALTHPSSGQSKFELLEFIGDRVVSLIIAEWLWDKSPKNEKEYSTRAAGMTTKEVMLQISKLLELENFLEWKGAESHKKTILSDATEALIGAIYLDAGIDFTRQFIRQTWSKIESFEIVDPKMALQKLCQNRQIVPEYRVIRSYGEPHDMNYVIELKVGEKILTCKAKSIKSGEKMLAKKFLIDS